VTLFYYISRLVGVSSFRTHDAYFAYAVVGLAVMEVLVVTIAALPARLQTELVAGTFERLTVSPFGAVAAVMALTIFPFLQALVAAAVTLAFAGLVFGLSLHWATVPLALPTVAFAVLAFAPLSFFVAAIVLVAKQFAGAVAFLTTGISLVGGFFFPAHLLPGWVRWTHDVQPFSPALELLRNVLVGTPMTGSAWAAVVKIAAFAAVLLPLGVLGLRLSVQLCRRRGTLLEY
jgi:ABC-2 type transport system permease protein